MAFRLTERQRIGLLRGVVPAAFVAILPLALTACEDHPQTSVQTDTPFETRPPASGQSMMRPIPGSQIVTSTPATSPAPDSAPSAEKSGMPVYPGAKPYNGLGGAPNPTNEEGMVVLQTTDSMQAVVDYYKERLTTNGRDGKQHLPDMVSRTQDGQPLVSLSQIEGGNGMKIVEVRQGDGVTLIELMHIPATQSVEEVTSHKRAAGMAGLTPSANSAEAANSPSGLPRPAAPGNATTRSREELPTP